MNANVLQRHLDHDVRKGFDVTHDREDFIVGQGFRVIAKQFSTARNRDCFRFLFRTLGYVHGAFP